MKNNPFKESKSSNNIPEFKEGITTIKGMFAECKNLTSIPKVGWYWRRTDIRWIMYWALPRKTKIYLHIKKFLLTILFIRRK
jgi:hypothetical protein